MAIATLTAAVLCLVAACTQPAQPSEQAEPAVPVTQEWFAARGDAQRQGVENLVDFYAEDVTLDHRTLGPDVLHGRDEALRLFERRWSRDTLAREALGEPFVSADGAVTHEQLDIGGRRGARQVLFETRFGPDGAISETLAMSEVDWREDDPRDRRMYAVDQFVKAYVTAWSDADGTAVRQLYADAAVIEDSLLGVRVLADGAVDLADSPISAGGLPGMASSYLPAPGGPAVFATGSRLNDVPVDGVAMLLTTADGAACTQSVAVWLRLDQEGLVESESRFHRLADLASCAPGTELPAGWWDRYPIPDPVRTVQTATLEVGGQNIAAYNGTPELHDLILWGFARFEAAGLEPPTVESITFYPGHADRCDGVTGLITEDRIILCFTTAPPCPGTDCADWVAWKRATVLHELGHAWMTDTVTKETQEAFLRRSGQPAWSSPPEWGDRGVELAAETLAWGLMDEPYRVRRALGPWACDDLAALFEILTGSPPDGVQGCEEGT